MAHPSSTKAEQEALTYGDGLCHESLHQVVDRSIHQQPSEDCTKSSDYELDASQNDLKVTPVADFKGYSTVIFEMDQEVWRVVHDNVMDWRDPSWTSMELPHHRLCKLLRLIDG